MRSPLRQALPIEDVGLLFFREANARVLDRHFDIVVGSRRRNGDASTFVRELAGIVGNGIDHEKSQRLVGLHHVGGVLDNEIDALHLETHTAALHQIEQFLQRKALDAQAHLALPHLDPPRQHIVVVVDAICQLHHVGIALATHLIALTMLGRKAVGDCALHQPLHLVDDSVHKRHDAIGKRHFCTLLKVALFVLQHLLLHEGCLLAQFLALLLEKLCALSGLLLP